MTLLEIEARCSLVLAGMLWVLGLCKLSFALASHADDLGRLL